MLLGLLVFMGAIISLTNRYVVNLVELSLLQALVLMAAGLVVAWYGGRRGFKRVVDILSPFTPVNIYDFLQRDVRKKRGPKIVVIGGGTGLSVLLKGLKKYSSNLTAVVTVTDDGGSSGRLRGELGVLPPGDIRRCLIALAETENLMDQVFEHRFEEGEGIRGHNLGNLLLTALTDITGDFVGAIREVSKVLAVQGQVLPATLEQVVLGAVMEGGEVVLGESSISAAGKTISNVFITPPDCQPVPEAVQAILEADAVVLGPGSLFTSILPNLLVMEIGKAVQETAATRMLVVNIMTQPGETTNFKASDHLRALNKHIGRGFVDYAIVNDAKVDDDRLSRYRSEGAETVVADREYFDSEGVKLVCASLLGKEDVAWHDPDSLASAIIRTIYWRKGLIWPW